MLTALGKLGCERTGTTADIQHTPAALRHLAEQQPVVISVVIPVEHSQTLLPLQAEPPVLPRRGFTQGHSRLIS